MRSHGRLLALLTVVLLLGGSVAATPAGAAAGAAMRITQDTVLTQDFVGRIFIEAHDVTLDCAGFKVTNDDTVRYPGDPFHGPQGGITIIPGADRVTVQNCVVDGGSYGITASSNLDDHPPDPSVDLRFVGNTVLNSTENAWDLHILEGAVLENNHAVGSQGNGFFLLGAYGVVFRGNTANRNGGHGVWTFGVSDGLYENNTASRNAWDGLHFEDHTGGELIVEGNNANHNRSGFFFGHPPTVPAFTGLALTGNKAANNSVGFNLQNVADGTISGNSASNNHFGFGIRRSIFLLLESNTARNNDHGFYLGDSSANQLVGNLATLSDYDGIRLDRSHDNLVSANTSDRNRRYGISALFGSSGNSFDLNSACNNGDWDAVDTTDGLNTWRDNNTFCTQSGF